MHYLFILYLFPLKYARYGVTNALFAVIKPCLV